MTLSFLNPWFWIGAVAVSAPIYLHLRRRKPHNLLFFSALRFLEDQPQPRQSPLYLHERLLFILRVLGLLLLIAGFAWPYLHGKATAPVTESRVYILDNTLSHQAGGAFEKARERVAAEVARAGSEIQVAVIELTSTPRIVVRFSDDHAASGQRIHGIEPSFQRGSYYAAFRQAATLLANSLGEKRKIVFLSDNQENQWSDNASSPPFLDDIDVEVPTEAIQPRPNVAVIQPVGQRIFLGDRAVINFSAQISHQSIDQVRVVLKVNGQELVARDIDLKGRPDVITFQTEWEADPGLQLDCDLSVQAEGDSLEGDNRVYLSIPAVKEGTVAVLAQSQYLKLALSPDVMRGHWAARFIDPTRISSEVETNNDAEVLCIESNYLQSGDARKLLERYLNQGRGVFLMVNRLSPASRTYLKELGFDVLAADSTKAGSSHFQYIFGNHPILQPFTSPDFGNLLEVEVTDPVRLRSSQAWPLIFTQNGDVVLFQKLRPGKLLVSAFGFERGQTSWPVHPTFLPFLDLCLQNSRPVDTTPTVFEPGEVMTRSFSTNSGVRALVVKGREDATRSGVVNGKCSLRLPERPGIYRIACEGGKVAEQTVCVNPPSKESQLTYILDPPTLKAWELPRVAVRNPPPAAKSPATVSMTSILQEHIWWWLLLAGFASLYIEGWWANFRRRSA